MSQQMGAHPTSPPAASNSEGSSTNPLPHSSTLPSPPPPPVQSSLPQPQGNSAMDETLAAADEPDKNPDLTYNSFDDFDSEEDIVKYQKYEADYARCLMAKYFSQQDIYGGDVFDLNVAMGDETIKGSRRPCVQSYADPFLCFIVGYSSTGGSSFPDETPATVSNGKVMFPDEEKLMLTMHCFNKVG